MIRPRTTGSTSHSGQLQHLSAWQTVTIFAEFPNDNFPDNNEVILAVANRGGPPHPMNTTPPVIGYELEGNQRIFSVTEHARPQTSSNDGAPTHPENISSTFNSVGGNVTQLSVTSYGESGTLC